MKYKCQNCDYVYDEEKEALGFDSLDVEWVCPRCGASKSDFELLVEEDEKIDSDTEDDESFSEEELEDEDLDDGGFKDEDY